MSDNFREGYRNEGDFDLRNNAGNGVIGYDFDGNFKESDVNLDLNGDGNIDGVDIAENEVTIKAARLLNGFYENNFVTNGLSSGAFGFTSGQINFPLTGTALKDADYTAKYSDTTANPNSSYFNNLVTPIQRRETFTEYLMEICRRPMISACKPNDWVVDASSTNVKASSLIGSLETALLSGTTATLPTNYQGFPRRVAFLRGNNNKLILDGSQPVPLGINSSGIIACYSSATSNLGGKTCTVFSTSDATKRPRLKANALWFQTRNGDNRNWSSQYPLWYFDPSTPATAATYATATVQQPLLVPVLQIYTTTANVAQAKPLDPPDANENNAGRQAPDTRWLPRAKDTTYNMVMAVGDVPGRPGETNGGLQNLARLLENWRGPGGTNDIKKTMILGSFMQLFRSAYATAPYFPVRNPPQNESFFGYTPKIYRSSGGGQVPFQSASSRQWGYDVALLKQVPDLFSTLFTIPKDNNVIAGNEYFREVGRDDEWVKEFVCKAKTSDGKYAANDDTKTPSGC